MLSTYFVLQTQNDTRKILEKDIFYNLNNMIFLPLKIVPEHSNY